MKKVHALAHLQPGLAMLQPGDKLVLIHGTVVVDVNLIYQRGDCCLCCILSGEKRHSFAELLASDLTGAVDVNLREQRSRGAESFGSFVPLEAKPLPKYDIHHDDG